MEEEPKAPDRRSGTDKRPPGEFTSDELQQDTARFLAELRRRAQEKERHAPLRKSGPPPADPR